MIAQYPASYPYLRLELFAPDLALPHHQNPYGKNLCLFGRGTAEWHPSDTLASVIRDRLPLVLAAGSEPEPDRARELEELQPEPTSHYIEYGRSGVLVIDSAWELGDARRGSLELAFEPGNWPLRGAVLAVKGDGMALAHADEGFSKSFGARGARLHARWVRLSQPPDKGDAAGVLAAVVAEHPDLARPIWQQTDGPLVDVLGVVFPEQIHWRSAGDGWVFLVRPKSRGATQPSLRPHVIRAGRAGRTDLTPRIRAFAELADKTVAVIGLGALGAPLTIELARLGVGRLRLLDFDVVEAGTIPRWPLGLPAVGLEKTNALGGFLAARYPFTETLIWNHRLGSVDGGDKELAVVENLLSGVDAVVDATAEIGVQQLLSDAARSARVPYICLSATNGAWGGLVARIGSTDADGCWLCLQLHLNSGTVALPPADPAGSIETPGCASLTFTGSNFELLAIVLAGIRAIVGTLVEYDASKRCSDAVVITLRDAIGDLTHPSYQQFAVPRHPVCGSHVVDARLAS